jgi:sirohydrochlorin ferrochelatase
LKTGLIILGHGSKAPEATETLAAITSMVRERVNFDRVDYASLQISKPALDEVVKDMAAAGMTKIMVVPFLIASGVHVKTDIPGELSILGEKYPHIEIQLGSPLGADPRLADIVVDRVKEMER